MIDNVARCFAPVSVTGGANKAQSLEAGQSRKTLHCGVGSLDADTFHFATATATAPARFRLGYNSDIIRHGSGPIANECGIAIRQTAASTGHPTMSQSSGTRPPTPQTR
jgi:hypothetical protein